MPSRLTTRVNGQPFKPFNYSWAFDLYKKAQRVAWIPEEIPMGQDVIDYNDKLTANERNLLTQIFRFFVTADQEVGNNYHQRYLNTFFPNEIQMMLLKFADTECFDEKTQLLTAKGWKKVSHLKETDRIAQYDLETQGISFRPPQKLYSYNYKGIMHYYKGQATDLMVTPNHDLILINPLSRNVTKKKSFEGKWNQHHYPNAGRGEGKDQILSSLERILIAIQADGNIYAHSEGKKNSHRVVLKLKKSRKIKRIKNLLKKAQISYMLTPMEDSKRFYFDLPLEINLDEIKNFGFFDLESLSYLKAREIVEEAVLWDGSIHKSYSTMYYYNTNLAAINKLQAVALLGGYSCVKGVNSKARQNVMVMGNNVEQTKCCYILTITPNIQRVYPKKLEVDYDGKIYCVSVPKQNVVSRRNGKIAITGNSLHVEAYALLIDTVGLPETEYSAFRQYKEMKDKFDYFFQFNMDNNFEIAKTLAAFGAFTEGLQLFASFAILLNFTRFNLMMGMGQIIAWSIRDENIHCDGIIKLYHTFLEENPNIDKLELADAIYEVCREIVKHEDAFIELAFGVDNDIRGISAQEIKDYIRYMANFRLKQLHLEILYPEITVNPLPWIGEILNSVEHANFFESRVTTYSKGATEGDWSEAF